VASERFVFLRRTAVIALVALCLARLAAVAQQSAAAAAIPTELAAAFVRTTVPADSAALVSFMPDQVAPGLDDRIFMPPSMHVIGSVVAGSRAYAFATSPLPADSVLRLVALEYTRQKWPGVSLMRLTASLGPLQSGGFRPAPPAGPPTTFCHQSIEALISAHRSPDAMTLLRIEIVPAAAGCAFEASLPPRGLRPPVPTSPLPRIYDPPNTSSGVECINSFSSEHSQTRLSTAMDASALANHYGKQLETQGWSPMPDGPLARRLYTRTDSSGAKQIAALTIGVSPAAPGCREGTLDVYTIRSR